MAKQYCPSSSAVVRYLAEISHDAFCLDDLDINEPSAVGLAAWPC
jgi:hypothetical protein